MVYVIDQTFYIQSSKILYDVKIQLTTTDKNTLYKAAILNKFNYVKLKSNLNPGVYKLILTSKGFEYEKTIIITQEKKNETSSNKYDKQANPKFKPL